MASYRILLVDDELSFIELLAQRLTRQGHEVTACGVSVQALEAIATQSFDVALFDIRMPEMDGLELLVRAKESQPCMEVVILTGHGDVETAIEAMKGGAYDYLTKPVQPAKLELTLQKAGEKARLIENNQNLSAAQRRNVGNKPLIGESAHMRCLVDMIQRVADSTSPVLVIGESGTGKELVARAQHFWSCRADKPFITINVGTLPPQLAESELFGHVKGAFTGAYGGKAGLVEMAHQGTLFLDEIGELEMALQVKLLRFLETGEFRRVGDTVTRRVEVRVVAATNRRLHEMVEAGQFRKDLYYRLNVVAIPVPPLRDRREDIPALVNHFFSLQVTQGAKRLSAQAMDYLMSHDYPGNVRELANMVERGILLSRGAVIEKSDLCCPWDAGCSDLKLESLEKEHIDKVLRMVQWNKPEAAELLGIALRTLYRKVEQYGLKAPGTE